MRWFVLCLCLLNHQAWSQSTELAISDPLKYVAELKTQVATSSSDISFAALKNLIKDKRVVHVGELHPNYSDHLIQLAALQSLHQASPNIAIGVEWFQQPFQPWLDAYILGHIDEAELLHQTQYYQRWRVDFRLLRPILQYARQHQIRILALNAPAELTRQVSSLGKQSLSLEQLANLPKIHPPSPEQQERLTQIFKDKIPPDREIADFIFAQRIWDETMAFNAVSFLRQNPDHKLLVFAGNFHLAYQAAIPEDMARQIPQLKNQQVTISSGSFEDYEPGAFDYFVFTDPIELPAHARMGTRLNTHKLCIESIEPDSAAEKAGLMVDDCLIEFNETRLKHYADLMLKLSETSAKSSAKLTFQRQDQTLQIEIKFD